MFRSLLRHIYMQPKAVRNKYALALSGTFTGLVALIWLVTNIYGTSDRVVVTEEVERASPFATVFGELGRQFAAVKASLSEVESAAEPALETPSRDPREFTLTEENRQAVSAEAGVETSASASGTEAVAVPAPTYREVQIRTSSVDREASTTTATTTQN